MSKEINKVEYSGRGMAIYSHINEDIFRTIDTGTVRTIYFAYAYGGREDHPDENDIRLLNTFFRTNKHITMHIGKTWMIPLLPEVECFDFSKYREEEVELLRNNTVRKLHFGHSGDSRTDLTALLPFGDTLESLRLNASQYKPHNKVEIMLNGMKKLKELYMVSVKVDLSKLNENRSVEKFRFDGSKITDWSGIVKFRGLKDMVIRNSTTMSDIDFLRDLPCLETAQFWWCSNIIKFPDLSHLKHLKMIYATECKRLYDVEELKKLKGVSVHADGASLPGRSYNSPEVADGWPDDPPRPDADW